MNAKKKTKLKPSENNVVTKRGTRAPANSKEISDEKPTQRKKKKDLKSYWANVENTVPATG